jgi:hypothetical protein
MMEDNEVAKTFISTIIGEQIHELELVPQETARFLPEQKKARDTYIVCQIDFLAKLDTATGSETVTVEVLKSKKATDIIWFRQYFDTRYRVENSGCEESGKIGARQIYSIYILLDDKLGVGNVPVIEINHKAKDGTANRELLDVCSEFIDSCHGRSWIVQVPELKKPRRNEIETLLSIFDRSYRVFFSGQIVNVPQIDFLEKFSPVLQRLLQALEIPEIIHQMNAEDDYIGYIRNVESSRAAKELIILKNKRETEKNEKTVKERSRIIEEKDRLIEKMSSDIAEIKRLMLLLNLKNSNTEN